MSALSASGLLAVWEQGRALAASDRALCLLAWAQADADADAAAVARLPVGARDAALLDLRERLFGSPLGCVVACPACGERLEFACDTADLRRPPPADAPAAARAAADGYEVVLRPPTTADLAAVTAARPATDTAAVADLLARCVVSARREEREVAVATLPPLILAAAERQLERLDPQARVTIALSCPACGHTWDDLFDIVDFVWTEIDAWARRTLAEIHGLASAYGWREPEILALSAARRRLYLEMIGS